jgi:hypothetical protein
MSSPSLSNLIGSGDRTRNFLCRISPESKSGSAEGIHTPENEESQLSFNSHVLLSLLLLSSLLADLPLSLLSHPHFCAQSAMPNSEIAQKFL